MAAGPLHPDNLAGGKDRDVTRGHGTRALGPSDSSDNGSDLVGAPDVDNDTDRSGTGERSSAAGDIADAEGADIDTDHIETLPDDTGEPDDRPERRKTPRH